MAPGHYDSVAEKILLDLEMAVKKDANINEFDVVPTSEAENRNSSPILKGENTIGLESWIIPHIYPYAHRQIMMKNNYKNQNLEKVISCLLGVALLNPEMSTVWSRRRELILSRKMSPDNELRLTRMALSRKPKSNEALVHRRWIISEILKDVKDKAAILQEELQLCEMIANRYHSNYHAWSHRMWTLQHLLPISPHWNGRKKSIKTVLDDPEKDMQYKLFCSISTPKYMSIINSEVLNIYLEEIENNFKWVSTHVSDHSGFHYRMFLINQTCDFLISHCYSNSNTDLGNDDNMSCIASQNKSFNFFHTRKIILTDFVQVLDNENCYSKILQEYFNHLKQNSTYFDLIASIVTSEIKSNHSLCLMYPGHEALWYYRRSLIHMYKKHILDNVFETEHDLFSHQDKNGVPHKKDFKYDHAVNSNEKKIQAKISDLYCIFNSLIIRNENDIISTSLKACDENEKKFIKDYEHWLVFYLKIK